MVDINYANAYTEVLEILKYIPKEDYNKIPKNKIELYETYSNKNYNFIYNPDKTLDEQNVSKIAKGVIAILYRDYWANESQREFIIKKQNYDRMKIEELKREKYDPNKIFSNKDDTSDNIKIDINKDNYLLNKEDIKWYKKFFKFIIKIFKK